MTILLATVLTALHLEDDNLVTLYERLNNLYHYLCALYHGSANAYGTIVVDEEHLVKLYCLTLFSVLNMVHKELLPLLHLELLTFHFDNCVHFLAI